MKQANTISRTALIKLQKTSDCDTWKDRIGAYLTGTEKVITIKQEDIDYAISNADSKQKVFIEKAGFSMSEDHLIPKIKSYKGACKILGITPIVKPTTEEQLRAIVKAANYLDNNNVIWVPDFINNNTKYGPYLYFSDGRWVMVVSFWVSDHYYPGGLYFKERSSCRILSTRFESLYIKWFNS